LRNLIMSDDDSEQRKRLIEREARRGRGFSLASAIGQEGEGLFEGESAVPLLERAMSGLCQFVAQEVSDPSGALRKVLERRIRNSETIVGAHFDDPFTALELIIERVLANDARCFEFVRQVDAEWGRLMLERPHFQKPGQAADKEDEYTHESVRVALESLLSKVRDRR
jgi:hypothetical protein